jgi:hypothetical protein
MTQPNRRSIRKEDLNSSRGLGVWLKQYSVCPASVKPLAQPPVLPERKNRKRGLEEHHKSIGSHRHP